jgi:hypothetical protein
VEHNIKAVGMYVRGDLFTRTIFMFDNKQLDEGGTLHRDYLKGENDKGWAVQSLVVKKKIKRIPGTSEFIPK